MRATDRHREPAARRPRPRAGARFAACLARELAGNQRVDLQGALELLPRGFPPDLAARIAVVPEPAREAA